jgi:putative transposase
VTSLWGRCRIQAGREAPPSAGMVDSQSVRTTDRGRRRDYDGGKKLSGRKRHILVDTTGLLLGVVVHEANIQDRQGVPLLLEPIKGREWIKEHMGWDVEIVRHSWPTHGQWVPHGDRSDVSTVWFTYERIRSELKKVRGVLSRRWVVERTFARMGRSRRMRKDDKYLMNSSESMVCLTMIRLMLRRLTDPSETARENAQWRRAA